MKPFFRFIALSSALILIVFSGCLDLDLDFDFVNFANPTVAPEEARVHRELFGTYIFEDPNDSEQDVGLNFGRFEDSKKPKSSILHIGRAAEGFPRGFLRLASVEIDHRGKMSVDDSDEPGFVSKIGNFYVLNLPTLKEAPVEAKLAAHLKRRALDQGDGFGEEQNDEAEKEEPQEKVAKWIPENYEGYTLCLVKPTKTGFAVHMWNRDFLKSEISAKRLDGKYMTDEQKKEYKEKRKEAKKKKEAFEDQWTPFVIEAKSEQLRAFFEKNEKEITGEPLLILKRVE